MKIDNMKKKKLKIIRLKIKKKCYIKQNWKLGQQIKFSTQIMNNNNNNIIKKIILLSKIILKIIKKCLMRLIQL